MTVGKHGYHETSIQVSIGAAKQAPQQRAVPELQISSVCQAWDSSKILLERLCDAANGYLCIRGIRQLVIMMKVSGN